MIKNSLLIMCTILLSYSVNIHSAEEDLTKEQLKALDNAPNDCLESASNGAIIDDSTPNNNGHKLSHIMAVGAVPLKGAPTSLRRIIDGPANLRDKPSGKVIGTFPHKFVVLLEGQKGDWFYLRGYSERACEGGWTYKTNIFKK
jgi:hypothetical protein